ncbi:hypothetical protein, partial [Natrinema pellirubrum]|uniref:hypothetical protein n=1 Tax=Natrinema pellirubrum TaxID=69525 RepID=UPI0019D3D25B
MQLLDCSSGTGGKSVEDGSVAGRTARALRELSDPGEGRQLPGTDRERARRASERADDRCGERGALGTEGGVLFIEVLP